MSPNELNGQWHNEHGSRMTLRLDEHGRLIGKFSSGVGLALPGEEFDVLGFAAGDLVAFVVNFGKYDSLTSWCGHLVSENGVVAIRTMWQMTLTPPPTKARKETWKGTWAGSDTFRREAPKSAWLHSVPSHPVSWSEFAPPGALDSQSRGER